MTKAQLLTRLAHLTDDAPVRMVLEEGGATVWVHDLAPDGAGGQIIYLTTNPAEADPEERGP